VAVNAFDNVGVDRVELKANGTVVGVDTAAPFSFSWNSTGVANGMNTLVATAYDKAGNAGASTPVAVNVANVVVVPARDTTPPAVTIDNPVTGSVSGTVNVAVHATDNSGAAALTEKLYVDNVLVASGKGGTLAYAWNTRYFATGQHAIKALATDATGNWASRTMVVTVVR
jgi:thermitase